MYRPLPWYFVGPDGQEIGPVPSDRLRCWILSGQLPFGSSLSVRLPNWDNHFKVHQLWPDAQTAFLLPPAWPLLLSGPPWDTLEKKDEGGRPSSSSSPAMMPSPVPSTYLAEASIPVPFWSLPSAVPDAVPVQECKRDKKVHEATAAPLPVGPVARAKDEVSAEIAAICCASSELTRADFDYLVRQHLHAIRSIGGMDAVRRAMQVIQQKTEKKARGDISNWPAYIVVVLKGVFSEEKDIRPSTVRSGH